MTLLPTRIDILAVLIRCSGVLMLLLVPLNLFDVPRRFNWKQEMESLSLLNRQIFLVHAYFICLVVGLFGLLSLLMAGGLLEPTPLARAVDGGIASFWLMRLVMQCFFYSRETWRGHRFFTAVHYAFVGLWLFLTVTFVAAMFRACGHNTTFNVTAGQTSRPHESTDTERTR